VIKIENIYFNNLVSRVLTCLSWWAILFTSGERWKSTPCQENNGGNFSLMKQNKRFSFKKCCNFKKE
jgi:hypothetical protein